MRKPFEGDFKLTQGFNDPCCRASYIKFGLKGHNGLDYALPTGTKVLAPHDGKIIEATFDPEGYGIYVKIENSIEGSVLAHLREYRVGVGDGVKEGDLIGYSDNSGNSTGPHLHWGYYRLPRDRQNGFAGFIDQMPFLTSEPEVITIPKLTFEQLVSKGTKLDSQTPPYDQLKQMLTETLSQKENSDNQLEVLGNFRQDLAKTLGTTGDIAVILGHVTQLIGVEDDLRKAQKERDDLLAEKAILENTIKESDIEYDSLSKSLSEVREANFTLEKDLEKSQNEKEKVLIDLSICKSQRKDLAKYSVSELVGEILNRILSRR